MISSICWAEHEQSLDACRPRQCQRWVTNRPRQWV